MNLRGGISQTQMSLCHIIRSFTRPELICQLFVSIFHFSSEFILTNVILIFLPMLILQNLSLKRIRPLSHPFHCFLYSLATTIYYRKCNHMIRNGGARVKRRYCNLHFFCAVSDFLINHVPLVNFPLPTVYNTALSLMYLLCLLKFGAMHIFFHSHQLNSVVHV